MCWKQLCNYRNAFFAMTLSNSLLREALPPCNSHWSKPCNTTCHRRAPCLQLVAADTQCSTTTSHFCMYGEPGFNRLHCACINLAAATLELIHTLAVLQARLQQAESLIEQQRLTIDRLHSSRGRNSRSSVAVGHTRQSENDYWRSWLQSSADCTSQKEDSPKQAHLMQDAVSPCIVVPSRVMSAGRQSQEAATALPHIAGLQAPACGRNSASASSVSSSHNARQHQQKQIGAKLHWVEPLSSNPSLINVKPCAEMSLGRDACQSSGCQSCGWQPGANS